jgi:uncharacterized membrane protein SpoIIM required for sporulation
MTPDEFVKLRQADWSELAHLLDQFGNNGLGAQDLERLGRQYRAATSDLARAQRDFPHARVTLYLNNMVARAHSVIYRNDPIDLRRIVVFYFETFPQLVRETARFSLAAFLLFISAALLSGYGLATNPGAAGLLGLEGYAQLMASKDLWTRIPALMRATAAAGIMTNNITVIIFAFAGGISFMLTTIYAMVSNGLIIGGLLGLAVHYGVAGELSTFIVAHGVIELSVIFIAGGAGLMMGWSLLHPGLYTRRDALALTARKAVRVLFGCVPLLVVAGLIEGFISPNEDIPAVLHFAVGAFTGVLLYGYLLGAGRPGTATRVRRLGLRLQQAFVR